MNELAKNQKEFPAASNCYDVSLCGNVLNPRPSDKPTEMTLLSKRCFKNRIFNQGGFRKSPLKVLVCHWFVIGLSFNYKTFTVPLLIYNRY